MSGFLLITRVLLGLIFTVSGWTKIHYPWLFARALAEYALLPTQMVTVVAVALPWLEFLVGIALILGVMTRGGAWIALFLNLLFVAVLTSAIWRGLDVSCGCFVGGDEAAVNWKHVVFDLVLAVFSFLIAWRGPGRWSVDERGAKERPK